MIYHYYFIGLYHSLTWITDLFDGITYRFKTELCFQQLVGQILFLPHQFVASFPTNHGTLAGSPFSDDSTARIDGVVLPNCRSMWHYFFVNISCLLHLCLCSQVSGFTFFVIYKSATLLNILCSIICLFCVDHIIWSTGSIYKVNYFNFWQVIFDANSQSCIFVETVHWSKVQSFTS